MVDLLCPETADFLDVDPYARELDDPLQELYQDLIHRLFEAPGSNLDDEDRGVGIELMLSRGFDAVNGGSPADVIGSAVRQDFQKDDRVQQVAVEAVMNGEEIDITIRVVANVGVLGIRVQGNGAGGIQVTGGPST